MDALRELTIWNRACGLAADAYRVIATCEDRIFREQIMRSSLSIPANIAEGYERKSRPQYAQFLKIAKGACAEMRTQLYIAAEVDLIDVASSHRLIAESLQVSKMINAQIDRCERTNDASRY